MFQPLMKYAEFSGRARRAEYWLFGLFVLIVDVILIGATGASSVNAANGAASTGAGGSAASAILSLVFLVFALGIFIPSLAVLFRRLHDINMGAAWALLLLIPVLGPLALLVMSLLDGTPGPNKYGADPKQRAAIPVVTVAAPGTVEIHHHYDVKLPAAP